MNIQIVPSSIPLVAGQKCSGKIVMQVSKQVNAKAIVLRLEGQEKTQVVHQRIDSANENQRREDTARETHGLVKHAFDVDASGCLVNGIIEPGNYDVPFSTTLPASLPSTMVVRSIDGYASIEYSLKVNIEGSGWISNYKKKQDVFVQSAPENVNDKTPFMKTPMEAKVNACCCLGRGSIIWGVKLEDTHICHGQNNIGISLSYINDSTASIDRVSGTLTQFVRWTARMNDERQVTKLHEIDFGRMTEMAPKTKEQLKMLAMSMSHETETQAKILLDLEENTKNRQTIPSLNPKAMDTYAGRLIKIEHKLHLVLKTGAFVTDPSIDIPLKIVAGTAGPAVTTAATSEQPVAPATTPSNGNTEDSVAGAPPPTAVVGDNEPEITVDVVADDTPSVKNLLAAMKITTNDLALIRDKKADPAWTSALTAIAPDDMRSILAQVDLELDQTNVMVELAKSMPNFTCAHLQAAIGRASEWNRTNMIEGLLPYCSDLNADTAKSIQDSLTDWEQMVTKRAFDKVLNKYRSTSKRSNWIAS